MPLSLILFLLYVELIIQKRGAKRAGYTDNIKLIYITGDIHIAYEKLKEDYQELLSHGEAEGSPFNPKKTEVQFFIRKRETLLTVKLPGLNPGPPSQSTRYLRLFLDKRLSFTAHVKHWAIKARRLGDYLRSLSSTVRGAPLGPIREAVRACVISTTLYGVEA